MARNYNTRYEYETSPRKLEPYNAPNKKKQTTKATKQKRENIKRKQEKAKKIKRKVIFYVAVAFSIFFAISYRNAQIDENFEKVKDLKAELASIEKENMQLEVAIESSLNLTNLEQQARTILGMQKLSNTQTEYVMIPKADYIEVASEQVVIEEHQNIFQKIENWAAKLFK